MTTRKSPSPSSLWERPEPAQRKAPEPLSRARIVRAALRIADHEGIEAVSLRNVGAALKAGPMRLYGYVDSKEELLELMVDAVYGELAALGPLGSPWRAALTTLAMRTRKAAQKHPWFLDLIGGRPHQGPHALTFMESALASVAGPEGFASIDDVLTVLGTVNAYVLGALQSEASELRAQVATRQDKSEWQLANWPYMERVLATGKFPMMTRVVMDATHPPADERFEQGLECVLDGLAARLK